MNARNMIETETMTDENGALLWLSNGRPVPMDVFREAKMPPPASQASACEKLVSGFLATYRKNARPMSVEERFEARAAFGAETTIVNVITGESTRL